MAGFGQKMEETRPSILCVTHQMSRKKRNYSVDWTVPYEMMNYKWYLMVLDQYMTILDGLRVSKSQGLMVSKSQAPKVSRYQGIKVSRSQGDNGSVWSCTGWYLVVRAQWDFKNCLEELAHMFFYVKLNFKLGLFSSTFWFEHSLRSENAYL